MYEIDGKTTLHMLSYTSHSKNDLHFFKSNQNQTYHAFLTTRFRPPAAQLSQFEAPQAPGGYPKRWMVLDIHSRVIWQYNVL